MRRGQKKFTHTRPRARRDSRTPPAPAQTMGLYPMAKAYYGFRVPMPHAQGASSVRRLLEQCDIHAPDEMGNGIALFADDMGVNVMLHEADVCTWRGPWYDGPEPAGALLVKAAAAMPVPTATPPEHDTLVHWASVLGVDSALVGAWAVGFVEYSTHPGDPASFCHAVRLDTAATA
ncbi:hypothetical protein psal_cds_249 [Pandoravirus salinus]|uniref:Uncharacterized protein n=1 Tax=Pandoravirus salinus TaxID=1349410 RepID=S4VTJ7_9VIRU|nr:hypothetical protein psal_cds_249 [Pandoravirus salinus]AGO83804.1 hypothetical protein psal_cds_249 [Pandoravirus salinus]